jgi:agmatine deiminase
MNQKVIKNLIEQPTPRQLGFRMPAEWEPQTAIWLSWPHNLDTWDVFLAKVRQTYVQIIQALHTDQKIHLLVNDGDMKEEVIKMLTRANVDITQIRFFEIPMNDTWIRDYGPTFLRNDQTNEIAMVNWRFNAWGGKYEDLARDDRIPSDIHKIIGFHKFDIDFVLEGGSIDVNGKGTVLTTTQCLLNSNRNPQYSQIQIEEILREYLNVKKVLWLEEGIAGDDTDGHIDDIARFVNPTTIVCAVEDDPDDENYHPLQENYKKLQSMTDQDNHPLTIIKLPMPGPIIEFDKRLPASYTNFYIGNKTVAVPIFGHENDQKALQTLTKCFPDRKVVGIRAEKMVVGLGTIHCCSQQQPR